MGYIRAFFLSFKLANGMMVRHEKKKTPDHRPQAEETRGSPHP